MDSSPAGAVLDTVSDHIWPVSPKSKFGSVKKSEAVCPAMPIMLVMDHFKGGAASARRAAGREEERARGRTQKPSRKKAPAPASNEALWRSSGDGTPIMQLGTCDAAADHLGTDVDPRRITDEFYLTLPFVSLSGTPRPPRKRRDTSFGEATGSAAGGAAAVGTLGGEGGCPRSLPDPGRAHVYVTVGGNSLELVSGVAGTPSLSFSGATGSAAGGAAVEVEEEEGLGREVLSADSSGSPSDLGDVHVHVTAGGNSLKLVLGVAGTPFFYSQVSAIQDQVAGGAAVRTPAEAAVERAGVRTGRGGGRRARRQAGRLLAQVRMGETAARVASARADGGIGRGAESIAALGRVRGGRCGSGRGGALGRVRGGVGWGGCRRETRTPALVARTMASKAVVCACLSTVV